MGMISGQTRPLPLRLLHWGVWLPAVGVVVAYHFFKRFFVEPTPLTRAEEKARQKRIRRQLRGLPEDEASVAR